MTTDTKKTVRTRFIKDTIRSCKWEIIITEHPDGKIELWKGHIDDCSTIIKEVNEVITKKKADKYKKDNEFYHIETYEI
jgi:hypothetical protein